MKIKSVIGITLLLVVGCIFLFFVAGEKGYDVQIINKTGDTLAIRPVVIDHGNQRSENLPEEYLKLPGNSTKKFFLFYGMGDLASTYRLEFRKNRKVGRIDLKVDEIRELDDHKAVLIVTGEEENPTAFKVTLSKN